MNKLAPPPWLWTREYCPWPPPPPKPPTAEEIRERYAKRDADFREKQAIIEKYRRPSK